MAAFTNELRLDATQFLATLRRALGESSDVADKIEKELKGIDVEIDTNAATNSLRKLEADAKDAGGKISAGLKDGLGNLGSSITGGIIGGGVAAGVAAAGELIVSGFKAVIDIGSQFETALQSVSAVTGVTGEGLDDIGNRARNLAKQFGGEATTQLGAFQTILSKFGPDLAKTPEALGKVSENVNILAKAAGLDAKEAVDALSNSMLQFGVDASDPARLAQESGRFINVLAASAKVGAAEIPQVAEAILQAGVAAKGANLSFEETNAAIQALAVGGKVGSEAGVGLRNVLGLLIKQSGPGAEALAGVGLSVEGLGKTLTTKGLAAALEELRGGIDKLGTDAEKAAFKATLFGSENAATAGILLDNVNNIREFTKGVTGTDEAFTQAKINMATFAEFTSRVSAGLSDFAITIFQGFKDFADLITGVLTPVFGPLFESLGGVWERIWAVVKPILAVIGGFIIANIVVPLQVVGTAARTMYEIINRAFDAVIRSLQPIVGVFKNLFGEVGKGTDLFETFKNALATVGEVLMLISDVAVEIGSLVIEYLLTPFQALVSVIGGVIQEVGKFIGISKENNKEQQKSKGIMETLREVFANIKGTIAGVTEGFRSLKTSIEAFFTAVANFDIKKALAALTGIGDAISEGYDRGFNSTRQTNEEIEKTADAAGQAADAQTKQAAATEKASKASSKQAKTELELAKERYKATLDQIKAEEEIAKTAIDRQVLTGDLSQEQAKQKAKELELATQRKITAAFLETFKAQRQGDVLTSVGVKVSDTEFADLQTQLQNSLQKEIQLELATQIDPKDIDKNTVEAVKRIEEAFKRNAKGLADGLLSPDAFVQATEGLRGTFGALRKQYEAALEDPKVKDNANLVKVYTEQIELIDQKLAELSKETDDALTANATSTAKAQVDLNKRRLELLKQDEEKNGEEIRRLLLENVDIETNLKLAAIKTTGEARRIETELILREAEKQVDGIEKKYGPRKGAGIGDRFARGIAGALVKLDFAGAFKGMEDEAAAATDAAIEKIKGGTASFQEAFATIGEIAQDSGGFFDRLREQLAGVFGEMRSGSLNALQTFSQNFDTAKNTVEELVGAMAETAVAGFAEILVAQEEFGRGSVLLLLSILEASIPALVALIFGKGFVEGPVGAVIAAATVATLLGLVQVAKAAINGFEEGGYTGNVGTKAVAGVVHGQEFVVNAKNTKRFRPMLEMMNRGQMPMMDTGEFAAMRMELAAIRMRLDSMPDGIQGRTQVGVQVGLDTYLYERDRKRAAVRSLRG